MDSLAGEQLRDTFAQTGQQYRLRAVGNLLSVSDNTLRGYCETAGIHIKRASDLNPGSPAVRVFDIPTIFQLAAWRRTQGYVKAPQFKKTPVTIAIDIIKKGTGKSTSTVELAVNLQLQGLNCLVVDFDIQANATKMMGYEADLELSEALKYGLTSKAIVIKTFASVLVPFLEKLASNPKPAKQMVEDLIKRPFGEYGPALIPADTFMSNVDQHLFLSKGVRELHVKNFINAASEGKIEGLDLSKFDVVLFDCPPSINMLATNALAAADIVVAPVKMDSFSVKGLSKLVSEIDALQTSFNIQPELVILPTYYAPSISRIGRMQNQLQKYQKYLSPCVISASEEFPKSIEHYLPLTLQKPTSNPAKEYKLFSEFIHAKILKIASQRAAEK